MSITAVLCGFAGGLALTALIVTLGYATGSLDAWVISGILASVACALWLLVTFNRGVR